MPHLAELMHERCIVVGLTAILCWVHRYAREIEKSVRQYQDVDLRSWRVDENSVPVRGKRSYRFRTVDSTAGSSPLCSQTVTTLEQPTAS